MIEAFLAFALLGWAPPQPTTAAANASTLLAVGKRPLGTFPETPPYPSTL